jgi:hypothetical protein
MLFIENNKILNIIINMKRIYLILLIGFFTLSIIHAQSPSDDQQAIAMLRKFYISYDSAWVNIENPVTLKTKLLSLQQSHCSTTLQNKINVYYTMYGLDHDLILNDIVTDASTFLNTLNVIKDTTQEYTYKVSFVSNINDPGDSSQRNISLRVSLVKENNLFKINNIE